MRRITANYIIPVTSAPMPFGLVEMDDKGIITSIIPKEEYNPDTSIEKYDGIIVPGFVNTHCHLELSYMKAKIAQGGGLIDFLAKVRKIRAEDQDIIDTSIYEADKAMQQAGIVAVGDISNSNHSFLCKSRSPIAYHTFIEMYGVDEKLAGEMYDRAIRLENEAKFKGLPVSITLHSPYSSSFELRGMFFKKLEQNSILSFHHQESLEELEMFESGKGRLHELMIKLGLNSTIWNEKGKSSTGFLLEHIRNDTKILLVHNTFSQESTIQKSLESHPNITWVICPGSNRYIQKKLPDIPVFIKNSCKIAIGTDSYASNSSLSVLDEMKIITTAFPEILLADLIAWGTLNGAKALNMDSYLGSLDVGKRPGLNLIKNVDINRLQLTPDSTVKPLFP
ncbi:MAG: amidohydrolase family protein [Bacteroidales bacterium]|nr:amidohydrolase family protein [Bacteroidales bacterium]